MTDRQFLQRWIVGLLIGIPIGAGIGGALLTLPLFFLLAALPIPARLVGDPTMGTYYLGMTLGALAGMGAVMGVVQGRLLAEFVKRARWIIVSAAALPVGATLGYLAAGLVAPGMNAADRPLLLPAFLAFVVTGGSLGGAQALLLRHRVRGAAWWALINMAAFGAAYLLVVTAGVPSGGSTGRGDPVSVIRPLMMQLATLAGGFGVITGTGMRALTTPARRRHIRPGVVAALAGLVAVVLLADYRTRAAEPPVAFVLATDRPVVHIAWTQGGAGLAAGGDDGGLRVWDTSTGKELSHRHLQPQVAWERVWSPDATRFVAIGKGRTTLSDASRGQVISNVLSPDARHVVWNPRGDLFALVQSGAFQIVDGGTGKVVAGVRFPTDDVFSAPLAWASSGTMIAAAGNDGVVRIWDRGGREVAALRGAGDVTTLGWSPDERWLAVGVRTEIHLWDTRRRERSRTLRPTSTWLGSANVQAIEWSPDGGRLAAIVMQGVHVWNTSTWTEEAALWDSVGVEHLAWNPMGTDIAFSFRHLPRVSILDVGRRQETTLHGHTSPLRVLAWSPDGTRLATADNQVIRLWRIASPSSR
jgi:WD40 repeat protein